MTDLLCKALSSKMPRFFKYTKVSKQRQTFESAHQNLGISDILETLDILDILETLEMVANISKVSKFPKVSKQSEVSEQRKTF